MSLKEPFYFRSAGHLFSIVGKLRSNDPRQRVIWTATQVKKWGPFVVHPVQYQCNVRTVCLALRQRERESLVNWLIHYNTIGSRYRYSMNNESLVTRHPPLSDSLSVQNLSHTSLSGHCPDNEARGMCW